MKLKSIIKAAVLTSLASHSLSAIAFNNIVKCPSVNFVKTNFAPALNQVTQIEPYKFDVRYYDGESIFDPETQHYWAIDIFVKTVKAADYNEAFALAQNTLSSIVSHLNPVTDGRVCFYLNSNGETTGVELFQYDANALMMKKMHSRNH